MRLDIKIKLVTLFLLFNCWANCQSDVIVDSLKHVYWSHSNKDTSLNLLVQISTRESSPDSILKYAELLIEKSMVVSDHKMTHSGYMDQGNAYRLRGDFDEALKSYFNSIDYAQRINLQSGVGKIYISIADIYSENNNSHNAGIYYNKGIDILRSIPDSISLARALVNAGDDYFNIGALDSAIIFTKEAENIFNKVNDKIGQAYSLGNLGMSYAKLGNDIQAEKNMNEAIAILEVVKDYYPISVYLLYIADIYLEKEEYTKALNFAKRSLDLAKQYGLKDQVSEANLSLSRIHEDMGDFEKSMTHYKTYITYRDSVHNIQSVQEMANYTEARKEAELNLLKQAKQNQQTRFIAMVIILALVTILLLALLKFYRTVSKEKRRSDELLLNILPAETAAELKEKGKVQAKRFENITVMFTDFVSFTGYAEMLAPEELVKTVDFYFSKFDEIIVKYDLEKIKTVGDAYMCAGGLPFPTKDHARKMILAAIEIAEFVDDMNLKKEAHQTSFEIRIGINSGPVVAGVVGLKKFAYDIWGDTVNVASRMESTSEPGKINISQATYELVKNDFDFEFRGKQDVKNRGMMNMYFVHGVQDFKSDRTKQV